MALPTGRDVLLSVLSPRMVYSMTEWPRMRAAAEAAGFGLVTWRSPLVSDAEWSSAVALAGWVEDRSVPVPGACLHWLGRPNHFPYSRVVVRNEFHPWPVWGVLPDAAWIASLRCRAEALASTGKDCQP